MNWKIYGLLITAAVFIADQLSKWYVVTQYLAVQTKSDFVHWLTQKADQAEFVAKEITSFLNIVMVWNPGVSFGLLQTNKEYVFYGLTVMALLVSIGFIIWLWRDARPIRAITVGLIVGGALGNVLDRLRFGAVIDFIDVHANNWHWPAFNVADSAITVGIIIVLIETLFFSPKSLTEKK